MIVQEVLHLNQVSARICHSVCCLTDAPPPHFARAADDGQSAQGRRIRALAAVARARIANAWPRLGASALMALAATSIVANPSPLWWFAGLVGVVLIDRLLHQTLLTRCMAGRPRPIRGPVIWIAAQSIYGGALGVLLWASP